jgi:hypothetical protein
MSKLKQKAEELRRVAAELQKLEEDNPNTVGKIISQFVPSESCLSVQVSVPLQYIGYKDFDARKMMCSEAGHKFGRAIADKLDYDLARDGVSDDGTWRRAFPHPYDREARYVAQVCVLTRAELKRLVQEAIIAGRAGA